ncbi:MAG: hypothetical protein ACRD38_13180 [Nitrososphaerales archaeon]
MEIMAANGLKWLLCAVVLLGFVPLAFAQSIDPIVEISPSFQNLSGDEITEQGIGKPVLLDLSLTNRYDKKESVVAIIDVRDEEGVTWYIAWQGTSLNENGNYTMSVSWLPTEAGEYQIRSFAVDSLEPGSIDVVSPVYTSRTLLVK